MIGSEDGVNDITVDSISELIDKAYEDCHAVGTRQAYLKATLAEQKRLNVLAELATLAERKRILSQLVLAPCEEPGKGKSSRKKFYHLTKKEFAALNPQDDE